jgi:hypothetical protein
VWQASDVAENLPSIRAWRPDPEPIELDVDRPFPDVKVDAVFSANTSHIISWPQVEKMFAGVARLLPAGGVFALYGPFNYGGKPTSPSNAEFDAWLRGRDPASGLRDAQAIIALGGRERMTLAEDNVMPANNHMLVFRRRQ